MTTITIDRELLEQAAYLLDPARPAGHTLLARRELAIAIRAALAAQPQTLDEAMELPKALAQAYENGYNAAIANGPAHPAWQAATAAERERCVKVCEELNQVLDLPIGIECTDKIRSGK